MFDERAAKAAIIKQVRRGIMDCLDRVYPVPFSFESLCSSLLYIAEVGPDLIERDLQYLCDKKLVRWTNAPARGFMSRNVRMYMLTPAGKEFVDGMTDDPALMP